MNKDYGENFIRDEAGLHHISEILREFYKERAREDLYSIAYNGIEDIYDSGGKDELGFLLQEGALSFEDIYRAQHAFLTNTLWRN